VFTLQTPQQQQQQQQHQKEDSGQISITYVKETPPKKLQSFAILNYTQSYSLSSPLNSAFNLQ
jgi:hypothetical protein